MFLTYLFVLVAATIFTFLVGLGLGIERGRRQRRRDFERALRDAHREIEQMQMILGTSADCAPRHAREV